MFIGQWGTPQDIVLNNLLNIADTSNDQNDEKAYKRIKEVYHVLDEAFYDEHKLDNNKMIDAAVKAYVDAIDDPYTVYMDLNQMTGFESDLKWEMDFEWIWAVVRKKNYYVLIEELIKGSPAMKAGLMPLDRIIAVDSGSVENLDINEAVNKIKGPEGTKVLLNIERINRKNEWVKEYFEIEVTREKLLIPSVMTEIIDWIDEQKIAYIDIAMIGEETERLFKNEIHDLLKNDFDGIILDLRWNGWGFLHVAVQIVSHFIPENDLVLTAKYRIWDDEEYTSIGFWDLEQYPIVVLVNEMTASAWEIIAMALQEQVWAKLIGMSTFGKGSIQTLYSFRDGASIKYTAWKRYAPSGKNIDKEGVAPDTEVEFDVDLYQEENIDSQLQKAKEILAKEIEKQKNK